MEKNNPDYIRYLLLCNDYAVERAVLAIFARQTMDEQTSNTTLHTNGKGFNGPDARLGTYYAKWLMSGKRLTGNHLNKARVMMYKYVRQLVEVATENMEKKALQK